MEEKHIKLATLALLTPIQEVLSDVLIPSSLVVGDEDKSIIEEASTLLKDGKPAVTNREYLCSIFNVLNGNDGRMIYVGKRLDDCDESINFPVVQSDVDQSEYRRTATNNINRVLEDISFTEFWLGRFCEALETELTYMPGSLQDSDISLFDQAKLCAAFALCIRCAGRDKSDKFILYSLDFSGIQDFIYTIQSEGALRTLRARSFYLEILMENMIDDILADIEMCRLNVLYAGGGHSYMLLPNDESVISRLEENNKALNDWLVDTFDISLFVGHGYQSCNADALRNIPKGSYSELFKTVSHKISLHKSNRYSASQILRMNNRQHEDYSRECKVCHRIGNLNEKNECSICSAIRLFSNDVLYNDYFVVDNDSAGIPLPGDKYLIGYKVSPEWSETKRSYRKRKSDNDGSYGLWIGDYTSGKSLEDMAKDAKDKGCIDRIGIIRADVDNLGSAISTGFDKTVGGNIMRTVALSRQLTLFFKSHINHILSNPMFDLDKNRPDSGRNASVCYSGGDDMFVVGEWDDIIGFAIDISNAFNKFTQGTLSISAGIGIYDGKYPINRIAFETEELEDYSKKLPGKKAVTLLDDGVRRSVTDDDGHVFSVPDGTYTWNEFEQSVIGDKFHEVTEFFSKSESRGMSFMYRLLDLVRNQDDRINFARFVYVLSRLEPGRDAPPGEKAAYEHFAGQMTKWINNTNDRRHLKTAMTLYSYLTRNEEER